MISFSSAFKAVACALLVFVCPCATRAQTVDERAQLLKDFQARHEAYASQLRAMDVGQLAARIEVDSLKGREPFNSMAYAELVSRGSQAAIQLRPLLTKADRTSLLGLLALRKLDDAVYHALSQSFRITVLADLLRGSRFFNTWGIPGKYRSDASNAFIAEGSEGSREAVQALIPLMLDKRPAPIWGSEGAMLAKMYKFRVCDYAWIIVMGMQHKQVAIAQDPELRDTLIAKTVSEL